MSDSPPPPPDPALDALIARARAADGQPPFSDGALVGLRTGERELLWLDGRAAAIVGVGGGHAAGTSNGGAAPDADAAVEVEFAVDPDARSRGLGTAMLERLQRSHAHGLLVWAHGDHPAARALAASHGLEPVRELWHMSAHALAVAAGGGAPTSAAAIGGGQAPAGGAAIGGAPASDAAGGRAPARVAAAAVTGFRPSDLDELLDVNARAFAHHPEQGRLSRGEFRVLESAPWFSAASLLLVREPDGGRLIGFCWLKEEHGRGEFYAVGVSPERQGEGWGRRLMEAGLSHLAVRGIREAHLYVEGDNEPAIRLYRSLGFERDGVDVQYRWAGVSG